MEWVYAILIVMLVVVIGAIVGWVAYKFAKGKQGEIVPEILDFIQEAFKTIRF